MNTMTAIHSVLHRSAGRIISSIVLALAALAMMVAPAGAQVVGYFANPYDTIYGGASGANGNHLNIGNTFNVTGAGITVYQLGAFDWQGDGLAISHIVTLFSNQTAIASVTVPAGTAAPLNDGFRFAPLSAPVFLAAGQYAVVAYQMNASDPYGDYNSGLPSDFNTGASVTRGGGIFDFVTSTTAYPTQNGGGYNFISASFTYIDSTAVWNGAGADNNWSASGNWNSAPSFPTIVTFAGSARLTNNNDLSGITLNGLTFDSAAGAFVLGGNDITLNGNIGIGANPAAPVTETVNLNMAWSASALIETPPNGTINLGGNITSSADTSLIKIDDGELTLGGTNAILSWDLNGGATTITGNTTISGDGNSRIYVGDGDYLADCNGALVIQPGAALTVTGSFSDSFVIGRDSGSGTVIQNGGTFTFSPANNGTIWLGATGNTNTHSQYEMNGGLLDMSGNTLGIGLGSGVLITGTVNQIGGVITNVNNLWVGWGNGQGVYTLSGGSIYIESAGVTTTSSDYAVNLGGGTVGAEASWSSSLNMTLTGSNGPVTFDPAGNTITLSGVLSGNGGLIATGSGTLELSGANTYAGDTTVNSGTTLQIDVTGSGLGAFRLASGALLNLNYSGTYAVAHFYTNGVSLPVGTYNAGSLPGFIVGSGNLQVASSISTGLWTGAGADNNWSTAGNWNQNAVPIFPIGLTFAGNTRLANSNDLTSITASSITFDSAAGAFTLNGNGITLGGGIGFNGNPAAPITQTVNLNMDWSASETIDTPSNGNLTLDGAITSFADTSLIKIDTGALTLGGTNAITSWDINGGTTTITGNTTINGDGSGRIYVGDGDAIADCSGTLVIQPGAVLAVTGSFADNFVIGRDSGSGIVVQNGGSFTYYPANLSYFVVGATSENGTASIYDMNGGLLDVGGTTLLITLADRGSVTTNVMNQIGGVITNVGTLNLSYLQSGGLGIYNLAGGGIYIGGGGITTVSGNYAINLGGGTVGAESSWSSSLNMTLTDSNGPVAFDMAGNTITLSGVLSGNGGLVVTDSGTLELAGANTYTGDTTVNSGSTLQLDATGSSLGAFRLANGALLNLNYSGTFAVARFYTNGVSLPMGTYNAGNLPGFIVGSGNLQVANSISTGLWTGAGADNNWSTAGNWNQDAVPIFPIGLTFAGSTRLANNNDLASITASSITFDSAAGAFVLGGNGITLSGNIDFNGNPSAPITQTVNLNMNWSASETIDTPANGNLTLGGAITSSSDTSLIKIDTGTLTLGGVNSIQSWDLNGGTTTITGNTTINGNGGSRIYVGDGDSIADCSGTLVIQPGAVLSVIGNYADSFVIGRDSGSGTVIQNGGILTFNCNQQDLWVGATGNANTHSQYEMNGGLLDMSGTTLGIGLGNGVLITGTVNQVGGVITNLNNLWVGWGDGQGIYTLSGGSIYIGSTGVTTTSGNYAVNLGGGTVGAEASWSSSLNMTLTGSNGPVTFDTAGNTITLSGALSGKGGLTVTDSGTLELSGANTYTGSTTVNGATLQLDAAGSGSGGFYLANGALLNLNYSGTYTVATCSTNGVALPAGVYTSGNLPAFITGSGSLTVAAASPPVVNAPAISGGNLILTGSGGSPGGSYTLLTSTNLAMPLAAWATNSTGTFSGSGAFSNSIPVGQSQAAQFFRLRTP